MSAESVDERAHPEAALPELVRSRVAFARRGLASVYGLQGLCCGLGAAALALAAGVHAGAELGDRGLFLVALVDGLLVAAAFAWEQRRDARQVARRVDRALELEGALVTAWEVEGRAQPGRLGRRLGRQVAATCSGPEMLRAVLPASAPFLALPFVAIALLFGALEEARYEPSALDLEALARDVQAGLASLSGDGAGEGAASLSRAQEQELRELLSEVSDLRRRLPEQGLSSGELADVQERVTELSRELADSEGARRQLERTLSSLDAARMALEGREEHSMGGQAAAPDEAGGAPESGGAGAEADGSGGTGLAPGAEDGRMVGQVSPPTPPTSRPEAGVLGSRAWPRGYEGLVRRWVESRRAAGARR